VSPANDRGGRVAHLLTPKDKARVERALVLVERRARYIGRRYRGLVDPEELVTVGKIGAVEVVRRYDEARDASFDGYALARIDGQMLSLVRTSAKAKQRELSMKRAALRFRTHHRAEYDILKETPETLHARLTTFTGDLAAVAILSNVETKRHAPPDEELAERAERAHMMLMLAEALAELSEDERQVLGALYVDDMDMRDTEAHLGVPYITVRRRHDRARDKLRKALVRRGVTDMPAPHDVPGVAPVLLGVKDERHPGGPNERTPRGRPGLKSER
jgi:RNA polymerase sigma factor FliA